VVVRNQFGEESVPAYDRVGLDDEQGLFPTRPKAAERDPEKAIGRPHPWSRSLGREDGESLAKGEVFDRKISLRGSEALEPSHDDRDSGEHRRRMERSGSAVDDSTGPNKQQDPPCANL
jgi:hypothetical protein